MTNGLGKSEKMKGRPHRFFSAFVLALMLFTFAESRAQTADDSPLLSDLLPKSVIVEMTDAGFPVLRLDDSTTREHKEIFSFWRALQESPLDVERVVDQLFGAEPRPFSDSERELYSMKYLLLREKSATPSPDVLRLSEAWQRRYIDTLWLMLSLTDFEEVQLIAEEFKKRIQDGKIKFLDLSPALRRKSDNERRGTHGIKLTERLPQSRHYQVSGFYHAGSGELAIDFSRSVEENFITFVHEMVHAADPQLDEYRKNFKDLWPKVSDILARFSKDPKEIIPLEAFDESFEQQELSLLEQIVEEARAKKLETLKEKLREDSLSEEETQTLRQWLRSAIGLTLENEYKAYAHSIIVYSRLRSRFRLFVDNLSLMREFTERLIAGDQSFALRLSTDHNAMDRIHHFLQSSYHTKVLEDRRFLQLLEFHYLQELELFLKNLIDRYAREVTRDQESPFNSQEILPNWARPGGFDLPTNPYQILTARISTAWTIAFTSSLRRIHAELLGINEGLLLLHAGVLALHDVGVGELKVLGLHFVTSPFAAFPAEMPESYRQDLDSLPSNLKSLFELHNFDPELRSEGSISGAELREKLVGLRLLKAGSWMDGIFPPLSNSVMGTRTFLEQLRSEISVNRKSLSSERIEELRAELLGALENSSRIQDQFSTLRWVAETLGNFSLIAESGKLNQLAENFHRKARFIQNVLYNHGVQETETFNLAKLSGIRQDLLKQLKPLQSSCADLARRRQLGFFPGHGPLKVDQYEFFAMVLCWEKKFYIVRQPFEFKKYMTTTFEDNQPQSRIFVGGRPVKLEALDLLDIEPEAPKAKEEKRSWFRRRGKN